MTDKRRAFHPNPYETKSIDDESSSQMAEDSIALNTEEALKLMIFLAKHDVCGLVSWDENLSFYVNCNDVFYWGCGDSEDITKNNIELFKNSVLEAGFMGPTLFCARIQKTRPQGAWYSVFNEKYHHLFNAVGGEREISAGNPKHQDDYKA